MDNGYSPLLPVRKKGAADGALYLERDAWAERFPRCYALFAESKGHETPFRFPATLTVFVDGGRLKAVWSDKSTSQSLFLTLDPEGGFWEQMEAYLRDHSDEWASKRRRV
jgi:hypothetical protein